MTSPFVRVVVVVRVVLMRLRHTNGFAFLLYAQGRLQLRSLWWGRCQQGPAPASSVANRSVQIVVSWQRVTPNGRTWPHDWHLKKTAVSLNYRPGRPQTASSLTSNTTITTTTIIITTTAAAATTTTTTVAGLLQSRCPSRLPH